MKAWLVLYQLGFFRVAEQGAERTVVSAGADDMESIDDLGFMDKRVAFR